MESFFAKGGEESVVEDFKVHTFKSSGFFVVEFGLKKLELLVVAGGGSGSQSSQLGGSGGGVVEAITPGFVKAGSYSVTVGEGGSAGQGGEDSVVFGIKAIGGASGDKELGAVIWSASSDKSSFKSNFSGQEKYYAGSGGKNVEGSQDALMSGQYPNGGGGGHGQGGSGFSGVVIIRYRLET